MKKTVALFLLFCTMLLLILLCFSCKGEISESDQRLLDSLKSVSIPKEKTIEGDFLLKTPEGCIVYKIHDKKYHSESGINASHKDFLITVCPDSVNSSMTN